MALVRKLQTGSKAPDPNNTPKDYSQVEKALYDNLYSMSSKEARRAKPAYDQVAALVRSGAMDKALKFNPDRTYSVDTSQLPEELKKFDWTGHADPLSKDMLGLGVKIRGNDSGQEALSSAMAALRTYTESNSTPTSTSTSTSTPTQTGLDKEVQNLTSFTANKHYHNDINAFVENLGTFKTNDERKAKVLNWAKEGVDDYLNDYEKNKGSYSYKDYDNVQALKLALSDPNPNWDKITEKAYALGWKMNDYLIPPKTQAELDAEKKAADEAAAKTAATAATSAITPHKPQAYIRRITTTYFHPKAKPTEVGSGKWGDILAGKGSEADYWDAVALGGDVASLGGTVAGVAGGLTSTAATWRSDYLRGHGFKETAGNIAMNLGFTALSLIPGAATAKFGVKAGADVAKAAKIAKEAKYGVAEGKALLKGAKALGKGALKPAVRLAKPAMIGYGLVNAGTAARQTLQDVQEGGLGNISVQDTRGLMHGVQAAKGLYKIAEVHAGTTKVQTQEASTSIKLKNAPEGIESELKIPKGADPKATINEHFDKVIKPKQEELAALNAKETPDNDAITKLKTEIDALEEAKKAAEVDRGIKSRLGSISGKNINKAKSERVIKDEVDERSWYPKKFQEMSIAKLKKNNPVAVHEEATKEPFDIKKIKVMETSGKSKSLNKKRNFEKRLVKSTKKDNLNKAWNKYHDNVVEHKEGGILKFANGNIFDIISKVKQESSLISRASKLGYTKKINDTTYANPNKPHYLFNTLTNKQEPVSGFKIDNNNYNILNSSNLPNTSSTIQSFVKPTIDSFVKGSQTKSTITPKVTATAPKVTVVPTATTTSTTTNSTIPDYAAIRKQKLDMSKYSIPQQHLSGNYYGGVTNDLIVKNWNPDILTEAFKGTSYNPTDTKSWDNKVPEILQTYIKSQPNLVSQLKNVNDSKFGQDWYSIGLDKTATPGKSKQPWEVWSDAWNKAGITIPGNTPVGGTTQSGTTANKPQGTGFKLPKLDKVDLLNTAMYLNTIRTNKDIGNAQRKGVADSMYTLPFMSNTYIRADRPHTLEADKQAAAINSKTARMAGSTADIDKGFGARLAGIAQGNILKDKAQMVDTQRLDQLRGQQLQMNANTAKYNTEVLGKNRGLAANAFGKIHGINANQSLAQNTALNNLLLANQKNDAMKKQREGQTGMYNILNDPKYKQLGEEYTKLSDENDNSYKKEFDTQMKVPGVKQIDWNTSKYYTDWQSALKNKEAQIKPFNERLKNIQMAMAYGQSLKKGGTLAKKVETDRKLFYKIINDTNDRVDKHSIDLSKTEENAMSSDKLFYEMIKGNNKKVN